MNCIHDSHVFTGGSKTCDCGQMNTEKYQSILVEAGIGKITNPVYETMTNFKTGNMTIRVWREEAEFSMGPDKEIVEALEEVLLSGAPRRAANFVDAMSRLERISAIEVLDKNKNGGLFYPDWH